MIDTYLYILGYGRSGSTLLDWLLDTHSRVIGLGEIGRLPGCFFRPPPPPRFCACGQAIADCAFWGPVVDHGKRLDPASYSFDDYTEGLLARAQESKPDARVLVDSSGNAERLAALAASGIARRLALKVVFLTRSVYGVVYSAAIKGYNLGAWKPSLLRTAASWALRNRQYAGMASRFAPDALRHVTYEALCADPDAAMAGLFDFLGLGFEDVTQRWHTSRHHTFAGNRGLRKTASNAIRNDREWEQNLTGFQKFLIRMVAGRLDDALRAR